MSRRAQFGVLVTAFIILATAGRGALATTHPVATVHLTEGWATFGQAVPEGAAVSGLQVGDLPTQTDVKTRWPGGSIRFAIVTAKVVATATYSITAAPLTGGTFVPAVQNASVSLNISSCTPEPLPGACPTGVHIAELPAPQSAPWLSGPLVHEARSVVRPAAASVLHPYLRVNFDTRVYNDGASRVDVSVENMLNMPTARTVGYDVALTVPGTPGFSKVAVQHHYLTRWRKVFSNAQFSTITPDLTPFNLARALPPYLSIVANVVDDIATPLASPNYEILKSGALDANMPAHSGRQELAPYPDWTARYLVHKNPTQRNFVLANGDLSGGWPVHVREPEADVPGFELTGVGTEQMISLEQRPTFWFDERAGPNERVLLDYIKGAPLPIREYGNLEPEAGSGQSRLIPDNAHQPSIAYVPYLLTGDRYYAEEMAFWANYAMTRIDPGEPGQAGTRGSLGILENQETRGYAWALRNLVDAAAYYPDASPVKAYLSDRVTANLQWLDGYAHRVAADPNNPLKILWLGYRGAQDAGFIAVWEQNYLAYAIDRANRQGFIGGLDHRDAIARLQLSLFTSEPAYPRSTILDVDTTFADGTVVPAGTQLDWGAPYLLNVATVPVASRPWENPTYFTTMTQIAVGTTQGPSRFNRWRPYPGYYGPEARLNLMIGVGAGWAGAQDAYDYLFQFIGVQPSACNHLGRGNMPDLACRAGWALDSYPPYTPPVVGGADTVAPVLTVPASLTREATSAAGAVVAFEASATDAVDGVVVPTCLPASGSQFALGATPVSCNATDAAGNLATGTFIVTVADTTPPALALSGDQTLEALNSSGAIASFTATATDAVSGTVTPTCTAVSGSTFALGSHPVTCAATDATGNSSTGGFTISVVDTTTPLLTMPANMTLEAATAAGAIATFVPTATDAVDATVAIVCTPASGTTFALGSNAVSCTATDDSGNVATGTFTVIVKDTIAPILTMPANQTREATSAAGAIATFAPTATDAVDAAVVIVCTPASGTTFALGPNTVSCTATDDSGNAHSGTFTVTVRDTTPPALTVPANQTIEATDANGIVVNFTATAIDLVDGTVAVNCVPASGSTFPIGVTTVNCTATDGAGNLASPRSFTVTVRLASETAITLVNPGPQTSTEEQWVSLQLVWSSTVMKLRGADPRPVHFAASGLPQALHIDKDGTISGRVGTKAAGVYRVTVTIRVGKQQVSQQFTWTILGGGRDRSGRR